MHWNYASPKWAYSQLTNCIRDIREVLWNTDSWIPRQETVSLGPGLGLGSFVLFCFVLFLNNNFSNVILGWGCFPVMFCYVIDNKTGSKNNHRNILVKVLTTTPNEGTMFFPSHLEAEKQKQKHNNKNTPTTARRS